MKLILKSFFLIAGMLAAGVTLTSCHKQCACIHNNGTITYYTDDQVDELNQGNCSSMIYQSGARYYIACDWE